MVNDWTPDDPAASSPEGLNSADETRAIPVSQPSYPQPADETQAMPPSPRHEAGETMAIKPQQDPSAGTKPLNLAGAPPIKPPKPTKSSNRPASGSKRGWKYILAGIAIFLVLILVGGFVGYQTAIAARLKQQSSQVAMIAATQFELANQEIAAGKLAVARRRLEYVIQLDPKFPGAQDKLALVMLSAAQTQAPTAALPTLAPTMTPTPDTRAVEDIFNNAQQLLRAQDWESTIRTLDSLRNKDIAYRTVDVDGMYYIAYRYRGMQKIYSGSMEPGIYDLALAERFGPLDREANGARNTARQYQIAITFWEINWEEAVNYFSQIAAGMPGLTDGSGWTAAERYRFALIELAKQYAGEARYCEARDLFAQAATYGGDMSFGPTATAVQEICSPSTATPMPTSAFTATVGAPTMVTPSVAPPTEVPTTETPPPIVTTAPPPEEPTVPATEVPPADTPVP